MAATELPIETLQAVNSERSDQGFVLFWWAFALRGGFAILFAGVLLYIGRLMGFIFFDTLVLVILGLLIGFYILVNALLLGVAGVFAKEHHFHLWWHLSAEAVFAVVLGSYIGLSLFLSPRSLALLAGFHAAGAGCFQIGLALKLRHERHYLFLLGLAGVAALGAGAEFLLHQGAAPRATTQCLSAFELLFGLVVLGFALLLRSQGAARRQPGESLAF